MAAPQREPAPGGRQEIDPAFLNAQYQAMEESLRAQLKTLVANRPGPPGGGAGVRRGQGGWWSSWRPESYVAIALSLVALALALWGLLRASPGEPVAEAAAAGGAGRVLAVAIAASLAAGLGIGWWVARRGGAAGKAPASPVAVEEEGEKPDDGLGGSDRKDGTEEQAASGWLSWVLLAAVGLFVVAGLLWNAGLFPGGVREAEKPREPESETPLGNTETAVRAPATSEPNPLPQVPRVAWEELVTNERQELTEWVEALVDRQGLEQQQISDGQVDRFRRFADTLREGGQVNEAAYLRRGLLEYIYARWEAAERPGAARQAMVILEFTDFDSELLAGLLSELELAQHLQPPYDPADPALQVAVIRQWMAHRDPSSTMPVAQ